MQDRISQVDEALAPHGRTIHSGQSRSFDNIRTISGLPPASGPPRVIAVGERTLAPWLSSDRTSYGNL